MHTVVCELDLQPVQHKEPGRNLHTIAEPNKVKTSGTKINKVMLTHLVQGTKIMQQTKQEILIKEGRRNSLGYIPEKQSSQPSSLAKHLHYQRKQLVPVLLQTAWREQENR